MYLLGGRVGMGASVRSGLVGRPESWVCQGWGEVMGSPLPFLALLAFPVALGWSLSPRWVIFKNPFSSKQKCHQGCNVLFIYCKETSAILGLILLLLHVCGVTLRKLPHLFNEGLGRLAAGAPPGANVQFSGRGGRLACELSHSYSMGLR